MGRKAAIELEDLPEGWVIIEKTRPTGQIDKFPHDTKTNKTFRSMVGVKKYLLGLDGNDIPCPEPLDMIPGSPISGSGPTAQTATATPGVESGNVKDGMAPQSDFLASTQSGNKRKRDDQDHVTPIKKETVLVTGDEEENIV